MYSNTRVTRFPNNAWLLMIIVIVVTVSCKRYNRPDRSPVSLTVVNAINDNASFILPYFGSGDPKVFRSLANLRQGFTLSYATDFNPLEIKYFPNFDTLSHQSTVLAKKLQLEEGKIYTQFVYGDKSALKDKLILEAIPVAAVGDSVSFLRFINLFEGRTIDVEQVLPFTESVVANLQYEELTSFIRIPCKVSVLTYQYRIKDHATGTVLATFSEVNNSGNNILNANWLYKSQTLTITGNWTNATSFSAKAFTVKHF